MKIGIPEPVRLIHQTGGSSHPQGCLRCIRLGLHCRTPYDRMQSLSLRSFARFPGGHNRFRRLGPPAQTPQGQPWANQPRRLSMVSLIKWSLSAAISTEKLWMCREAFHNKPTKTRKYERCVFLFLDACVGFFFFCFVLTLSSRHLLVIRWEYCEPKSRINLKWAREKEEDQIAVASGGREGRHREWVENTSYHKTEPDRSRESRWHRLRLWMRLTFFIFLLLLFSPTEKTAEGAAALYAARIRRAARDSCASIRAARGWHETAIFNLSILYQIWDALGNFKIDCYQGLGLCLESKFKVDT